MPKGVKGITGPPCPTCGKHGKVPRSQTEADYGAAAEFRTSVERIRRASMVAWGKPLYAERDLRAGPDANTATKGHVTRALYDELLVALAMTPEEVSA